jgi:hypothetical protein
LSKNIKSKELKEELKIALNFLRRTTTTITSPTLTPQVIIISNSREEVEILFQPIVEEQSKQTFKPRPMEEIELQQHVNKDSGKEFIQELFEEHVCSVIPQCPRSRTKAMMK